MPITLLPPEVAARIAAGEVIDRPAAALKELIENSLDAGAREIRIELRGAGLDLIRVTDDGCGIPAAEVPLALARYATSKLRTLDDLNRITTLGFRGEALASIAAVSDLTLLTRPATEPAGTWVVVRDGRILLQERRGCPVGTTVSVHNLFGRLPARRRFLSNARHEQQALLAVATHYALGHPDCRFSVTSEGRLVFQSPGQGDLRAVLERLYGPATAGRLLPVAADWGWLRLRGFLSPPGLSRSGRQGISLFVRGRWVQSRPLTSVIEEVYRPHLGRQRSPIVVLLLDLPPEEVDPNVHPAKTEVRLVREAEVVARLRQVLQEALTSRVVSPVPSLADPLRVRQAPLPTPRARRLAEPTVTYRSPSLRPLGQVGATFIIAEGPEGLYLVNQHRAHERVLYEELRQRAPAGGQLLLEPVPLQLTPAQATALAAHLGDLDRLGFALEPFGGQTYLLRAIPLSADPDGVVAAFCAALETLTENPLSAWLDHLLITVACRTAIKAGRPLDLGEMRLLLDRLLATPSPRLCPHGAPIMLHFSQEYLNQQFARR